MERNCGATGIGNDKARNHPDGDDDRGRAADIYGVDVRHRGCVTRAQMRPHGYPCAARLAKPAGYGSLRRR